MAFCWRRIKWRKRIRVKMKRQKTKYEENWNLAWRREARDRSHRGIAYTAKGESRRLFHVVYGLKLKTIRANLTGENTKRFHVNHATELLRDNYAASFTSREEDPGSVQVCCDRTILLSMGTVNCGSIRHAEKSRLRETDPGYFKLR